MQQLKQIILATEMIFLYRLYFLKLRRLFASAKHIYDSINREAWATAKNTPLHSQQRENAWHVHWTLSPAKPLATHQQHDSRKSYLGPRKTQYKEQDKQRITTYSWWGWFNGAVTSHKHSEASSQNNIQIRIYFHNKRR